MNLDNEKNENLINQEPDFITFGDYPEEPEEAPEELSQEEPEEDPEELSQEEPEEDPEELSQEEPEEDPEVSELEAGTTVDYYQDFQILENIGFFQLFFLGTLTIFFLLWLVCKFFNSFF